MSKICPLCDKKPKKAITRTKLRGKYNPTGVRRQKPNLQWAILPDGSRQKICVRCKKSLYK